jgi:hypothetical protein
MSKAASKGTQGKNNSSEPLTPEIVDPVEGSPAAKREPRKRIRRTTVEEFSEAIHAAPAEDATTLEDEDEEQDDLEFEAQPLSDAEIILSQVADDNAYNLRVDRLVNYDIDGRTDLAAAREFCTNIKPPTLDYLAVVSRSFGGGQYSFTLFKRGAGVMRRWDERIAKTVAPEVATPPAATVAAPAPQATHAAPSFRDQLQEFVELTTLLGLKREPNPAPAAQPQQLPPADPTETFIEQFEKFTVISEKLMPSRDKGKSGGIVGFMEAAGGIIESAGKYAPSVLAMLGNIARQQPQLQQQQQPAPNGHTQQPPAIEAAPVHPVVPVLAIIVEDLRRNKRVGRAADAIEELLKGDEQIAAMVQGLLAKSDRELLAELSQFAQEDLSQYAHAEDFITDLKEELTPDDEVVDEGNGEGESAEGQQQ